MTARYAVRRALESILAEWGSNITKTVGNIWEENYKAEASSERNDRPAEAIGKNERLEE